MSVVCIVITNGWQHDLRRLTAFNRAYELSGGTSYALGKTKRSEVAKLIMKLKEHL